MGTIPVPILSGVAPFISNPFGMQSDGVSHPGVDFMYPSPPFAVMGMPYGTGHASMPANTPALAAMDGVVVISQDISTGGYIRIDHGGGFMTQYMHLRPRRVDVGASVREGQVIGTVGYDTAPGHYTLYHLHFETMQDGEKVDPANYVGGWQVIEAPGGGLLTVVAIAAMGYALWKVVRD